MTTLEKIRTEITELFKASGVSNSSLCFAVLELIDKYAEQEPCELLIIKSDILLHQDDRKKWMDSIKREKESGVIILPPYFEPLLVPANIEIKIEQEPCDDVVSRGVFEQVKWERDIAIEQLNDLGYELGQKIEPCEDVVSRQAVLDGIEELKQSPWATDKRGNGFEYLITEALDIVADLCVKQEPPVRPQEPKTEQEPKTDILDKIRAEIEQEQDGWFKETDGWWCYEKTLQIIDKYTKGVNE